MKIFNQKIQPNNFHLGKKYSLPKENSNNSSIKGNKKVTAPRCRSDGHILSNNGNHYNGTKNLNFDYNNCLDAFLNNENINKDFKITNEHKVEVNNIYQRYAQNNYQIKINRQSQENKITKEFPLSFETPKNGQSKKEKSDLEKNKEQKKNYDKGNQSKRYVKENKKELDKEVVDKKDEKLKHIEQKNKNKSISPIQEYEYLKKIIKEKDEKIKKLEQQNLDEEKKVEELNSQIDLLKKENNDLT